VPRSRPLDNRLRSSVRRVEDGVARVGRYTKGCHGFRSLPVLTFVKPVYGPASADLPGIRQALTATRHLLEMYRRQLTDEKTRRTLQRLDRRLLAVASMLDRLATAEK